MLSNIKNNNIIIYVKANAFVKKNIYRLNRIFLCISLFVRCQAFILLCVIQNQAQQTLQMELQIVRLVSRDLCQV